jgi:putative NADPH-quinone reductase
LKRNILSFVGIGPTRSSIVGNVEGLDEIRLQGWLDKVSALGGRAR